MMANEQKAVGMLSGEQIEFIRAAIDTHGAGSLGVENMQVRRQFDTMLKDYADLEKYYDEHEDKPCEPDQ